MCTSVEEKQNNSAIHKIQLFFSFLYNYERPKRELKTKKRKQKLSVNSIKGMIKLSVPVAATSNTSATCWYILRFIAFSSFVCTTQIKDTHTLHPSKVVHRGNHNFQCALAFI